MMWQEEFGLVYWGLTPQQQQEECMKCFTLDDKSGVGDSFVLLLPYGVHVEVCPSVVFIQHLHHLSPLIALPAHKQS